MAGGGGLVGRAGGRGVGREGTSELIVKRLRRTLTLRGKLIEEWPATRAFETFFLVTITREKSLEFLV